MRKAETGTTQIEFYHHDELVGPVTLDLEVDWTLTPGLPASRTEPAEGPELDIREIRVTGVNGTFPCPEDVHDAFVADEDAIALLQERAISEARELTEAAADDAAHAVMGPDL